MTPYAMLYTIAAGVPIAWAALAIAAVLRRYGRPERAVWLAALVLALVVPAILLLDPLANAPTAPAPTPATGVLGLPEFVLVPEDATSLDYAWFALLAWVIVSGMLAIRWAIAAYRLARASRSWHPGTLDGVSVWMTDDVGPAVSGVFRPRVLAPAWLHTLPARQRALVLLHEEEHIRARDPLLIAGTRIARILTPWNPVVWLLSSRLVRAVELDCDRRVLRRTSDVAAYGHTLLTVSEKRPGHLVIAAAFAESEAPLRTRILAMTTPPHAISLAAITSATILGVVLLVGAMQIPVPAVGPDVQVTPTPDPTPTVTAFDAPPLPPAPPPPEVTAPTETSDELAALSRKVAEIERQVSERAAVERELTSLREPSPAPTPAPAPEPQPAGAAEPTDQTPQPIPQPSFTPMSVRPQLTNAENVREALTREYPAVLRDAGIGGAPVLWLYIGTDGTVQRTMVQESSGIAALDEAAQNVARAMRFTPALNRDQRVPVWVQIPIRFATVN